MAKTKTDGQVEETKSGIRLVYTDTPSDPTANRNISVGLHPRLYDALVTAAASKKGTHLVDGRAALQDGTIALCTREAIAEYSAYQYANAADLSLVRTKESKQTTTARGVVQSLFAALREKMDFDASRAVAGGILATMGVSLTEQEFADLWDSAAAA